MGRDPESDQEEYRDYTYAVNAPIFTWDEHGLKVNCDEVTGKQYSGCLHITVHTDVKDGWFGAKIIEWKPGRRNAIQNKYKFYRYPKVRLLAKWLNTPCCKELKKCFYDKGKSVDFAIWKTSSKGETRQHLLPGSSSYNTLLGQYHHQEVTLAHMLAYSPLGQGNFTLGIGGQSVYVTIRITVAEYEHSNYDYYLVDKKVKNTSKKKKTRK